MSVGCGGEKEWVWQRESHEGSSPPKPVWQWGGMAAVLQETLQSFRTVQIAGGETPDYFGPSPLLLQLSLHIHRAKESSLHWEVSLPPDYIILCFATCLCTALSCSMLHPSNADFTEKAEPGGEFTHSSTGTPESRTFTENLHIHQDS